MAGLKAIVLWFPPGQIATANGLLVTLGGLGAVTATVPAQMVLDAVGWRGLFLFVAWLTIVSSVFMFFAVPERPRSHKNDRSGTVITLWSIFQDRRFWKLAPMSATCIGTAWALQGLWAAPWLSTVNGYDRAGVVHILFLMALSLSAAGLGLGFLAESLRKIGVSTETLFGVVVSISLMAQLGVLFRITMIAPPILWSMIGAIGAGTVLAYAILPTYFLKEASGRANAALNILHVAVAFGVQGLIGFAVDQWPNVNGRRPVEAYQFAFGTNLIVQSFAFFWFLLPSKTWLPVRQKRLRMPNRLEPYTAPQAFCPYRAARQDWLARVAGARAQADGWRTVALTSMTLCVVLLTLVAPKVTFSFSTSQSEQTSDQTIWSTPAMAVVGSDARMAETAAHGFAGDTKTGGSDDRPISR